jgi:hypothetical protein
MLTLAKLKIFARIKGDIDMFSRAGRAKEKETIDDEEWRLIDTLIQDATVIDRQLGSEERTTQATRRIIDNCENNDVVAKIHSLASKLCG